MLESDNPVVHQFIHAEPDGPIAFHYPAQPIGVQLGLKSRGA
jgi:phospholipid/cholesterol/gamma-HCH transport system ATP-binding protein